MYNKACCNGGVHSAGFGGSRGQAFDLIGVELRTQTVHMKDMFNPEKVKKFGSIFCAALALILCQRLCSFFPVKAFRLFHREAEITRSC